MRFDGVHWEELGESTPCAGGISDEEPHAMSPSIAVNPSGEAVVAWTGNYENGRYGGSTYVKRWDGARWAELGGSTTGLGLSDLPGRSTSQAVAIDDAGLPTVVWLAWAGLHVQHWNGSEWVEVGEGSATGDGIVSPELDGRHFGLSEPSVVLDREGRPVVAWSQWEDRQLLVVKRWTGIEWESLGELELSRGHSPSSLSLSLDTEDQPVVAWLRDWARIEVRRWTGVEWEDMELGSPPGRTPTLAADIDGRLFLAWTTVDDRSIVVVRWDGTEWVEYVDGGHGVEDQMSVARELDLAIDSDGRPVVAWSDHFEVRIARWDGAAWMELMEGSVSEGGVSNSAGPSRRPSLAVGGGYAWIAWDDWGESSFDVYLRRAFEGPDPDCEPSTEVCDEVDNDCDWLVDEACDICVPEVCDGEDNDCDGLVDEGCDICEPVPEACDGEDNDCDGEVDEGCGEGAPGSLRWVRRDDAVGSYLDVGPGRQIYVAGTFTRTAVFGEGEPGETILEGVWMAEAEFVAEYTFTGAFDWARRYERGRFSYARGVVALGDGGVAAMATCCDDHHSIGIHAFDSEGTDAWSRFIHIDRIGDVEAYWFAPTSDGGILVKGRIRARHGMTVVLGEGEPEETVLVGGFFMARYRSDGTILWARNVADGSRYASVMPDDGWLVAGHYSGEPTFGAGEPDETTLEAPSPEMRGIYLARYRPDGSFAWARAVAETGTSFQLVLDAAATDGGVTLGGTFPDTIVFEVGEPTETELTSHGESDVFVARFHPDGSLAWARSVVSETGESLGGVVSLPDGGALVAGLCTGPETFGPGEPDETTITCTDTGVRGGFLARFAADGSLVWARTVGGADVRDIALLDENGVVLVGRSVDGATFGEGEPTETTFHLGGGFLAVYEL